MIHITAVRRRVPHPATPAGSLPAPPAPSITGIAA